MVYGFVVGIAAILFLVIYLLFAFALSVSSIWFWIVLWICCGAAFGIVAFVNEDATDTKGFNVSAGICTIGIPVFLMLAGLLDLFQFQNLSHIAPTVEKVEISEMFPETNTIQDDAIVDTKTAEKNANKVLGTLGTIGSHYVANEYFVISMKETEDSDAEMYRVAPLGFDGFWQYLKYGNDGIPGYIKSKTTETGSAVYVELEQPIFYSPSAFWSKDLHRHIRFTYPNVLLGDSHFEIDNTGKAYWVTPYYRHNVNFGGKEVIGTIVTDANNGACWAYRLGEEPSWVSCVYSGDYVCDIYSWQGKYFKGLSNALFSKEGCWKTTEVSNTTTDGTGRDYAYKFKDGQIWSVTGVKTLASDTHSTIAVLMVSQKDKKAYWCDVAGADEEAVMTTASEEFHAYEYMASFPSLINIDGELTYVCVVTDRESVVKNWVFINMKDISKIITAKSESEGFAKYRKMLKGNIQSSTDTIEVTTPTDVEQIDGVRVYTESGNTYVELDINGETIKYAVAQ